MRRLAARPVVLRAEQALEYGFVDGILDSLEAVLPRAGEGGRGVARWASTDTRAARRSRTSSRPTPRGDRVMDVYSHLLVGADRLSGHRDRRRGRNALIAQILHLEYEDGPRDQPLHQLAGRVADGDVRGLRRDAVRQGAGGDDLHRPGLLDRGDPARGRDAGAAQHPAARPGAAAPAVGPQPGRDPRPDPRGRRGHPAAGRGREGPGTRTPGRPSRRCAPTPTGTASSPPRRRWPTGWRTWCCPTGRRCPADRRSPGRTEPGRFRVPLRSQAASATGPVDPSGRG